MSIVSDRRCDGCGEIRPGPDHNWWAVTPPGDAFAEDDRVDFCDLKCLGKWLTAQRTVRVVRKTKRS